MSWKLVTVAVRIELERRLPIGVHDGFDYITDPGNWPEYWPRLVRIASARRWREPGSSYACFAARSSSR